MRVRTEERRQRIIDIAGELFRRQGYDRTSMSEISKQLGGSKATLYGYFSSKEELLLAVVDVDVSEQSERLTKMFLSAPTLREGLMALGTAYLQRRVAPLAVINIRMVASQPEETGVGTIFYDKIIGPAWRRLAARMQIMMDEGRLRQADPWVATMHWKGLIEQDIVERRLIGATSTVDPEEIRRAVEIAIDAFLRLYGPEEKPKKPRRPAAASA